MGEIEMDGDGGWTEERKAERKACVCRGALTT
jgi:hypothetical protein